MSGKISFLGAVVLAALLLLGVGVSMMGSANAVSAASSTPAPLVQPETVQSPNISAIDMNTPTCYLPQANTNRCYIAWNYQSVTASTSAYMLTMTVSVDNRLRAIYNGFFQGSFYVPYEMTGPGFGVDCGQPSGGSPNLGNTYSWTVRARDTTGSGTQSSGVVTCPADVVRAYLPLIKK